MNEILTYGNGMFPTCPLTGRNCDSTCMWLQFTDDGYCACSIALIPVSDVFSPDLACVSGRGE